MPSKVEKQALQIVRALYTATDGQPMQWRSLATFQGFSDEAMQHAVHQGWLIVEGGHSVCLTDLGRQRTKA